MMAKDSKLFNIGDKLIVNVHIKAVGVVSALTFNDSILGITTDRYISREFRISTDDIFYSEWLNLNPENLLAESGKIEDGVSGILTDHEIIIQVRYTRLGVDTTGAVEFVNINFNGTFSEYEFKNPTVDNSIFKNVIGENETRSFELNIFKKLYFRGIVPQYITRGENQDNKEDKDYISLSRAISKFFAMFIKFFKGYEKFDTNIELLREYLRQMGMYFDESNITLEELQYLANNFYDEIRKRGTNMIFKYKGDFLTNNSIVPVDGEFIRLLRNKKNDELLYDNIPMKSIGWNMMNSSPMYRGTPDGGNFNKTKNDIKEFSLSKFQTFTSDAYKVDANIDYEISFQFKVDNGTNIDMINFGVEGYDTLNNKLSDSFVTPNGASITNNFIVEPLSKFVNETWYTVRGIIHAYSTANVEEIYTNIGMGNNLYFNNKFVKYIRPKIILQTSGSAVVDVKDYKIKPLIFGSNILPLKNGKEVSNSMGFIQAPKIFYMYVKNNNNSLSEVEITDIIEKYLLPYNMNNMFVFINNY